MCKPLLFSFLMLAAAQVHCTTGVGKSDEVKQDTITQHYEIKYSEDARKLEVLARFGYRAGSTALELTGDSFVEVNGQRLEPLNGVYRSSAEADGSMQEYKFVYRNNDGKVFEQSLKVPPKVAVESNDLRGSRSKGFSIVWVGEPLGSDEELAGSIGGTPVVGTASEFTLSFQPEHLKNLKLVSPSISLSRSRTRRLEDGKIWTFEEYKTAPVPFVLDE